MQKQPEKISNPKTTVPNTPQLNDRDYCDMMLNTCKKMVISYATALNECSNEAYYDFLFKIFKETSESQRRLYNLMFKKGWYSIETTPDQKIKQTIESQSTYQKEIH